MSPRISYRHSDLDIPLICDVVASSYWGTGRRAQDIERAIANCYVVGMYDENGQIGFARLMSDGVYSAYIYDLFIVERHRGTGLSLRLMRAALDHPELASVTGWILATRDAHGLYERFGFRRVDPDRYMTMNRSPAG